MKIERIKLLWGAGIFAVIVLAVLFFVQQREIQALDKIVTIQDQAITSIQDQQKKDLIEITLALQDFKTGTEEENNALEKLLARQGSDFESQIEELEKKKQISERLLSSTNRDLVNNIEEITDKLFTLESNSKEDIVDKWDDVTVRLNCRYPEGKNSYGSGVYFGPTSDINFGAGNDYVIFTNSHVLEEDGKNPNSCTIIWSNGAETAISFTEQNAERNRASYFEELDAAFITLSLDEVKGAINSNVEYRVCPMPPQSGEEILVLGYPRIGSNESITSTNGIISGYENNYFITSAKISKGNSGGAAVSVKNDCYFGIPTLVRADEVESLGRILDAIYIFE